MESLFWEQFKITVKLWSEILSGINKHWSIVKEGLQYEHK